jgi:hypothetical protein
VFEALDEYATDIAPALDRYEALYISMLRRS